MKRLVILVIVFLTIAGTAYANKIWLFMPKFRGADVLSIFRVTDGGGADFVVTDNGGETYNVK
jgi:hypothetical protein